MSPKRLRETVPQRPVQVNFENTYTAVCNVVETLTCSICKELMNTPSTFSTCGHTFCWECVVATLEGKGIVSSVCPECKQPGWKNDLQTNHLLMNLIGHVKTMMKEMACVRVEERRCARERGMVVEEHTRDNKKAGSFEGVDNGGDMRVRSLENDVAVIEAVLELCRTMPVSENIPRSLRRKDYIVPDSQDESQLLLDQQCRISVEDTRILKERSMNVETLNSKSVPCNQKSVSPMMTHTVRRMWWKAKPKTVDGPIRMVVDIDSIDDPGHVQELVDRFVSLFGDKVSVEKKVSKDTTHVVVGTDSALVAKATPTFLQACTVGCWVVSFLWIDASNQNNGSVVEEKNYQVQGHRTDDHGSIQWRLPENSRLRCIAGKRGIFDGMSFVVPFMDANRDLVTLIELADGSVFGDVPTNTDFEGNYVFVLSEGSSKKEFDLRKGDFVVKDTWVYKCIGSGEILDKDVC